MQEASCGSLPAIEHSMVTGLSELLDDRRSDCSKGETVADPRVELAGGHIEGAAATMGGSVRIKGAAATMDGSIRTEGAAAVHSRNLAAAVHSRNPAAAVHSH